MSKMLLMVMILKLRIVTDKFRKEKRFGNKSLFFMTSENIMLSYFSQINRVFFYFSDFIFYFIDINYF